MTKSQASKSAAKSERKSSEKRIRKKAAPKKTRVAKPKKARAATRKRKPIDYTKPLKNAKEEGFSVDIFGGMVPSDAYRKWWPSSLKWTANTVHARSSEKHSKVQGRIAFFQSKVANERIMDKAELAEMYSDICRTRHSEFLVQSADGVWMHDIGPETLHQAALKKVKTRVATDQNGKTVIQKQFDEIELESKVVAGKALAELMGYNAPAKHALTDKSGEDAKITTVIFDKEAIKVL